MKLYTFLLLQFFAHLLADYYFQTHKMALDKNAKGFKSKYLVWHILFVFVLSWLLSFQIKFVFGAAAIAIIHYFIDGFKPNLSKHKLFGPYAFFLDQVSHLLVLTAVTVFYFNNQNVEPLFEIPLSNATMTIIVGYLLCLKPANIFVKEFFRASDVVVSSDNEMPNAGKVIGSLERILTLTFILIGQYHAVGFLIAAKSILRYRNDETLKTEYVLIGTMLSFGIAVVTGIILSTFNFGS